ncbi:hypothetical protein N5C10_07625 [Acinetobacter johnsonii]|uniref:Uncharacterized protein n=1 Tax=Acinetobacter johnsonii TaxID=40214 RepID=A0AA42SP77_ACIJO|nr:hypothetical protein [Acinetobacter johnsonii]MDH0969137.1 hypothetical protein [Acinetobacter johnsonii]
MGLEFAPWVVLFVKACAYALGFLLALPFIFMILIVLFPKQLKSTERVSTSDSGN